MEIKLTKDQYKTLLKTVFLGNWLINAPRVEPVKEFDEMEEYIFSHAEQFGLTDEVEKEQGTGATVPSKTFEDSVSPYIDEYNQDNMWQELIFALAHRDLVEDVGEDNIKEMAPDTFSEKLGELQDKYEKEFTENGILNLRI